MLQGMCKRIIERVNLCKQMKWKHDLFVTSSCAQSVIHWPTEIVVCVFTFKPVTGKQYIDIVQFWDAFYRGNDKKVVVFIENLKWS